ncbi:Plant UBX domain-containing protein 13 [Hibiscus syriacus]|uniref:Plant UBX domain-containing protein 13 n=1 Tax=Hibiscus syriacus TaxID=106335 RepID=A0A6A2X880_HIBSY|nr:plant UBX domain-containing protein 8-like [Hibiscus syriacus]KAE8671551.1 Plant UBX domain-containing protein 13 [Hibiscus syriacus]
MARTDPEAIETFMGITGASEAVAIEKLEEHGSDLNAAVNAHFSEGDRTITRSTSAVDDAMDIDNPLETVPSRPVFPLLPASRTMNAFSLLDSNFYRSFFDGASDFTTREPSVTHPREVREIPIEVNDSNEPSNHSGHAPVIEDVSETEKAHEPNSNETVIIDEVDEDSTMLPRQLNNPSQDQRVTPSAPVFDNLPDYGNDVEEQMIRAAIEASKWEVEDDNDLEPPPNRSHMEEDAQLAEAVSLSLKSAEQERALHVRGQSAGTSESVASKPAEVKLGNLATSNGRLMRGSSSIQDDAENVEQQPLVRHRPRQALSGSRESVKEIGAVEASPPSSPGPQDIGNLPQSNGNAFPSDEWGGISSEEHDEAVMLEAAMFGGIPESGYRSAYAPHQFMRPEGSNPWRAPHPPSPSLAAQRLIREQQDDEYYASLQADREKELKAIEEAEARCLEEEAARKAALEEKQRKEEELRRKVEEEQECERQLAAKEASLPQEPAANEQNAVTLLVRMPDGSRRGRRFLKSDRLQSLYDFIDIGRGVKPGTYRLVRPYPRRAFGDGERNLTLNELGLTSKQEALFLELM